MSTKRSGIAIIVVMVAALAGGEPSAYQLCKKAKDGPEITGNYACPYLYSSATGRWYPNPMFYVAKDALHRWHARWQRAESAANFSQAESKTYRPTKEK